MVWNSKEIPIFPPHTRQTQGMLPSNELLSIYLLVLIRFYLTLCRNIVVTKQMSETLTLHFFKAVCKNF